jgi:hypothetical protein
MQFEKKIMNRLKALEIKYENYHYQHVQRRQGSTKQVPKCNSITQLINSTARKFVNHHQIQELNTTSMHSNSRMSVKKIRAKSYASSSNHFPRLTESHELHNKTYNIEINQDGMILGYTKVGNRNVYISTDTGYPRSLMSIELLSKLGHRMEKRRRRPAPNMATLLVDNIELPVVCSISLPITINGIARFHNMLVVRHLSQECIIGADFINKHHIQVKTRPNKIQLNQKHNGFTQIPNQKYSPMCYNTELKPIERSDYLSTNSYDTKQTQPNSYTSANISLPNSIISSHEHIHTEVINPNNNINKSSATASTNTSTLLQSNSMSSVNNINTQTNRSELYLNQLNVKTQEAHNKITPSHTINYDWLLERLNRFESLGNAIFNNRKKT